MAGFLFYISTKSAHGHFDYTFRIATALLSGHVGITGHPGAWLNEMVPGPKNQFFSVFPLGAVLVTLPSAILAKLRLINGWPAHATASVVAGLCVYFFYGLTHLADMSRARRVLLALFPIFGSWAWTNLGFAGAWQVALGFAVLGQAGALYYTLIRPSPILAGFWFAVGFGNRTELAITGPVYAYLWLFDPAANKIEPGFSSSATSVFRYFSWPLKWTHIRQFLTSYEMSRIWRFVAIPATLLLLTAAYNLARFDSVKDFGYTRIPGVLNEPWYRYGLFSFQAIRWNAYEMLFRGFGDVPNFPFLVPYGFGCSIIAACPFLFLLFREGGSRRLVCWGTISVLTLILWMHGNTGGWQYSYRYAMILLPWILMLLVENGPKHLTALETFMFVVSVVLGGMGVYEFLWTSIVHM